ncbi:MAG TPA: hypothetical protein VLT33_21530 [Labilithrix sp.]|nr:hypothetical protein [Labilithrix sp.]
MKDVIVRWAQTIGCTAFLATVVATGTGCGAISAAANPKVAWALQDPAPMSIVVRRADVAEKTAQQVDRVMTDTPANDDSAWLGKVGPQKEESTATLAEVRQHQLYAPGSPGGGARVVAAEVWAKSLAQIEPKSGAAKAASAPQPAAPAAPAAPASPAVTEPAEPVAKTATPDIKKGGKKGSKPGSLAKNDKAEKADKKSSKKAPLADKPATAEAAPAAAAAPAATLSASSAKYPSLLAAIDKDLGSAWGEVMEKKKAMGELKAQIAALEAANDVKGISDTDKKANKKTIEGLEKQVGTMEKEADKLAEAFIPKAKAAASKAGPEVREKFGAVLVNLRQAVDDAKTSNGAAAVRYPMAATTLVDSTKAMAAVYVADVIEEKTGKRPSMAGFQPGVTMEGGKVAITLNGLSASDMGKIPMGELTTEVATRTTKWVGHAMGLLGTISSTKDMLTFEDDVLAALIDGFKAGGWSPPAATTIPDAPVAGAAPGAATPRS